MAILTIIMGALTGALITFLQNGTYTIERDDHSGGALVLSSYLNRDFGSSDSVPSTSTSACSGPGTAVLTLSWTEWVASVTAPAPAPSGGTWRASYVVTADPSASTRYQLHRRLCAPDGSVDSSLLLRNLTGASPAAVVSLTSTVSSRCPAGEITVALPQYVDDAAAGSYRFSGCLKGRQL